MTQTVKEAYLDLVSKGFTKKQAAKIVQHTTGKSAATGRPLKRKAQSSVEMYNMGLGMTGQTFQGGLQTKYEGGQVDTPAQGEASTL